MSDFTVNLNDFVPRRTPREPLHFELKHPQASLDMFGFLPQFIDGADPRPAKEQLHANYGHGGGWDPFQTGNVKDTNARGFSFTATGQLKYPGDPPTRLLGEAKLRDEVIRIYEHAWVAVIQPNGDYELCRMD